MLKQQGWAFIQCLKAKPFTVISVFFFYVFLYIMQPIELFLTKKLVEIAENEKIFLQQGTILLFLFFLTLSFSNLQFTFSMVFIETIENKVISNLQQKLFKAVSCTNLINLDSHKYLTKLERARWTCWYNLTNIVNDNLHFFGELITAIFTFVIMWNVSWVITVIYILFGLGKNILEGKLAVENYELEYELDYQKRTLDYLFGLMIERKGAKEIRCFGTFDWLLKKWNNCFQERKKKALDFQWKWLKIDFILEVIFTILDKIVVFFIAFCFISDYFTISEVVLLFQSKGMVENSVGEIISRWKEIFNESNHIKELRELIEEAKKEESLFLNNLELIEEGKTDSLKLQNIYFQYKNGFEIKNLNFHLKKGEIVALVGENGCGKSTLVKLAAGLLKPSKGKIRQAEGELTAVFQDYVQFEFSIRDNVGFGNISLLNDEKEILLAMKKGMSLEILNKAKDGLNTILGKNFEQDGLELSGGEWQRIAVSRGLMGNPIIIFFDEPTASLDPLAEVEQFKKIRQFLQGKSAVLVSHRIGITRMADRIIYMEKGAILEEGSHIELMEHNGKYKEFFCMQSKWYKNG